jgi:tripartite ATP-independent transporter DctM subunit
MSQDRKRRLGRGALLLALALVSLAAACGPGATESIEPVGGADSPVVLSIERVGLEPNAGPPCGGDDVIIRGKNFSDGVVVVFGHRVQEKVTFISATELHLKTPHRLPAGETVSVAVEKRDDDDKVVARGVLKDAWSVGGISPRLAVVIACAIAAFALLGGPIFLVLAAVTLLGVYLKEQGAGDLTFFITQIGNDGTLSPGKGASGLFEGWLDNTAKSPLFIAIPLFTFAGTIMAESKTPQRLVDFARALIGWLPGGVALVALVTCSFFTAFTGASGVTIIALGGLLYPVLLRDRYSERFSLGLLTTCGSLGLLFKPSLPVYIYAIIARVDGDRLFTAALIPGLILIGSLALYSIVKAMRSGIPRSPFSSSELARSFGAAFWELPLIPIVIGGMYGGLFTAAEASAVTAAYAFVVQVFVYRDIKLHDVPRVVKTSMVLVGAILMILGMALGFMDWLTVEKVPQAVLGLMESKVHDRNMFLLMLNVFLLIVGCFMEGYTATLVVVPLIAPIAKSYGVDSYHLGVIFLLNLEIAYSLPPVGFNLFLSALRFGKPVVSLYKAAMDFVIVMAIALIAVTYYPPLSLCLFDVPGVVYSGPRELDVKAGDEGAIVVTVTVGGVDLPEAEKRLETARAALAAEEKTLGLSSEDLKKQARSLQDQIEKIEAAPRDQQAALTNLRLELSAVREKMKPLKGVVDRAAAAEKLVQELHGLGDNAEWRSRLDPDLSAQGLTFNYVARKLRDDEKKVSLKPGEHEITVTATDGHGHVTQEKLVIRVAPWKE